MGETIAGPFTFETGPEGWTTFTTAAATAWRQGPPGASSSQSFQVAPYENESLYLLTSPQMEHPGGRALVTFNRRQNTEDCCDFLAVEWSSDGALWNGIGAWDAVNPSYPVFDEESIEFAAPAGALFVRFRLTSDQLVNGEGAYVDDVLIER